MALKLEIATWPGGLLFDPRGLEVDPSTDAVLWVAVDLDPETSIENELVVQDFEDISNVPNDVAYSLTIMGTQRTEALLRLSNRTQGIERNLWERPLTARLYEDGVLKVYGPMYALGSAYQSDGMGRYEFTLFGGNADWQRRLKDVTLRDVVASDSSFSFPFGYNEIQDNFENNVFYDDPEAKDAIYYPIVNYGTWSYQWVVGDRLQQGVVLALADLRPFVYARYLIERCFAHIGYSVRCNFILTDEYSRLIDYVLAPWDQIAPVVQRKQIRVTNDTDEPPGTLGSLPSAFENVVTDVEGRWDVADQVYTTPSGRVRVVLDSTIKANKNLTEIRCRIMYTPPGVAPDPLATEYEVWTKAAAIATSGDTERFFADLEIDTKQGGLILVAWIWDFLSPPSPDLVAGSSLSIVPIRATPWYGDTVNANWISQDYALDYLRGCFHMHNMRVIADPVLRKVTIEPHPDFYLDPMRNKHADWTRREDRSRPREIEGRESIVSQKVVVAYKDSGDASYQADNEGRTEEERLYGGLFRYGNQQGDEVEAFDNPYFLPTSMFRDRRIAWEGTTALDNYFDPGSAPFMARMWGSDPVPEDDRPPSDYDHPGSFNMNPGPRRLVITGPKLYAGEDSDETYIRLAPIPGSMSLIPLRLTDLPYAFVWCPFDDEVISISYADEQGEDSLMAGLLSRFYTENLTQRLLAQIVRIPLKMFTADPQIINPREAFKFGDEYFFLASLREAEADSGLFIDTKPKGKPWIVGDREIPKVIIPPPPPPFVNDASFIQNGGRFNAQGFGFITQGGPAWAYSCWFKRPLAGGSMLAVLNTLDSGTPGSNFIRLQFGASNVIFEFNITVPGPLLRRDQVWINSAAFNDEQWHHCSVCTNGYSHTASDLILTVDGVNTGVVLRNEILSTHSWVPVGTTQVNSSTAVTGGLLDEHAFFDYNPGPAALWAGGTVANFNDPAVVPFPPRQWFRGENNLLDSGTVGETVVEASPVSYSTDTPP